MVRKKNKNLKKVNPSIPDINKEVSNKEVISIAENYNFDVSNFDFAASGSALCYEDYNVGEKINHIDGMTVEEAEHMMATKLYQNNAKVHFNHFVEKGGRFGKRIVYGLSLIHI